MALHLLTAIKHAVNHATEAIIQKLNQTATLRAQQSLCHHSYLEV